MKKFWIGFAVALVIIITLIAFGISVKTIFFFCATVVGIIMFVLMLGSGIAGMFCKKLEEPEHSQK